MQTSKTKMGLSPFQPRQSKPYDAVINQLQCLESTLAVFSPVWAIDWRYPSIRVVFEEGDQRDATWGDLQDVRAGRQRPGPTKVNEKTFVELVGLAVNSQSLVMIESFWREGHSEWVSGKFINAFFSFYFVIEGLYGNGKTKNVQIIQAFLASQELKTSVGEFLAGQHPLEHLGQLIKMINVGGRLPTVKELIELLVSIRGRLHHFQNNPNRPQGSPLVHDEYEGIAYLARYLAHKGILAQATNVPPNIRRGILESPVIMRV